MFGRKRKKELRNSTDEALLNLIYDQKDTWDRAKVTEEAVDEMDEAIRVQTQLARAKYLFLYKAAKNRQVNGHMVFTEFQRRL